MSDEIPDAALPFSDIWRQMEFEIERLRAENVQLLLELDMQQATILVPSQKDDQRRIERLNSALKEALDEAAALRAENETLRRDVKTAIMGDSAELQDVKRENEKLRKALISCAIDLEVEINARYHDCNGKVHPALQRKYDNDMSTVRAAAAAIRESGDK